MTRPLRLMVFDRTCRGPGAWPGLSTVWAAGARLYRQRGLLDAYLGAAGWREALGFLARFGGDHPIGEVQFWGHGKWAEARIGAEPFDERALLRAHALNPLLTAFRRRLASPQALFWLRTCETFGAAPGRRFAAALGEALGCRVAGHTFVIAFWQSGLHVLEPGARPSWDAAEGLRQGTPAAPVRARHSLPDAPNTITCFESRIPANF